MHVRCSAENKHAKRCKKKKKRLQKVKRRNGCVESEYTDTDTGLRG